MPFRREGPPPCFARPSLCQSSCPLIPLRPRAHQLARGHLRAKLSHLDRTNCYSLAFMTAVTRGGIHRRGRAARYVRLQRLRFRVYGCGLRWSGNGHVVATTPIELAETGHSKQIRPQLRQRSSVLSAEEFGQNQRQLGPVVGAGIHRPSRPLGVSKRARADDPVRARLVACRGVDDAKAPPGLVVNSCSMWSCPRPQLLHYRIAPVAESSARHCKSMDHSVPTHRRCPLDCAGPWR